MSKYNIDLKKYIAYRNILIRKNTLKYDINIKNNYTI